MSHLTMEENTRWSASPSTDLGLYWMCQYTLLLCKLDGALYITTISLFPTFWLPYAIPIPTPCCLVSTMLEMVNAEV